MSTDRYATTVVYTGEVPKTLTQERRFSNYPPLGQYHVSPRGGVTTGYDSAQTLRAYARSERSDAKMI